MNCNLKPFSFTTHEHQTFWQSKTFHNVNDHNLKALYIAIRVCPRPTSRPRFDVLSSHACIIVLLLRINVINNSIIM